MLDKTYDPKEIEARLYPTWEQSGAFKAHPESAQPPYCIVIPPPNVTGSLHMGHALEHTMMDALTRRKRMQGYEVLWQPGMDHAGIATQSVVEQQLAVDGKTKEDFGRELFIDKVWDWKRESGGAIGGQMRRLGDGVDWGRERFTMDDGLSRAVRTIFKRLYDAGLIYQAERLVNWSPVLETAISDLEVRYEDLVDDPENASRRMLAHIGLPWDPRCLEFHRTDRPVLTASNWQVRQPINRSSVERWRRYERFIGPLREALGDELCDSEAHA